MKVSNTGTVFYNKGVISVYSADGKLVARMGNL